MQRFATIFTLKPLIPYLIALSNSTYVMQHMAKNAHFMLHARQKRCTTHATLRASVPPAQRVVTYVLTAPCALGFANRKSKIENESTSLTKNPGHLAWGLLF